MAAMLSVASNSALVVGKLLVGIMVGSVSVISEAIHSAVDLVAALVALFAVRTSHRPADREHPFGHGKIENVSGTIEALLIFAAALWIIYEAVGKLMHPEDMRAVGWGVLVMGVSSVVNIAVSEYLFRVARETESIALEGDAWHLRTDVYTSAGVMFGLILMLLGDRFLPAYDWRWLDPVAAIIVALLIARAAWRLTQDAASDLLDASLPASERNWLEQYIRIPRPGVHGYHNLRTRRGGEIRFVQFHLIVHGDMTVNESHYLTDVMTVEIQKRFPDANVTIHVEPCDGLCEPKCLDGCLLTEEQRIEYRRRQKSGDPSA
jgi:cation diffusion facilitator family transporter